ncbi:MAG: MbcA/ParS/Xre antitoxin family protein [Candidatus Eremiobacteraeota bacterium]|nr:MbcA/ParS/Xre antitoxin family protein [Candidatus Eremiobacteraeota bacterium]
MIDRALQVMNGDEIGPWLNEPEPLLGNSVPMNVLTIAGPSRVIRALDGIGAGAFA